MIGETRKARAGGRGSVPVRMAALRILCIFEVWFVFAKVWVMWCNQHGQGEGARAAQHTTLVLGEGCGWGIVRR